MKLNNIAAIVALLLLAATASFGVYEFQLLFVPKIVAIASAASFEATYIGLALATLTQTSKKRAAIISLAAVAVSITYNSLSALFHLNPALLEQKHIMLDIVLAILHGLPLALVAYFVADLIIHQQPSKSSNISKQTNKLVLANSRANDEARLVAKPIANSKAKYICSECGYKAKSSKALNGHMAKHRSRNVST